MPQPARRKVLVVDYDSSWPRTFASLQAPVREALAGIVLAVEHVGSTAVPGLAAKPIIDIDVVLASRADLPEAIARLAVLGYVHAGDLGIEGREAFQGPVELPLHNLYVCARDSVALANHLAIRDCLRGNSHVAMAYGQLKKQLALRFSDDVEGYVSGKTDFLLEILRSAGFSGAALETIREENSRK